MKKKLDLSFVGNGTIAYYGLFLRSGEDSEPAHTLDNLIYNALSEAHKEEYFGRMDVTIHIELPDDPVLNVVAE